MLIGFDASRAFVSEATGTENYSLNLLKALAKVDRKNRYRVYLRQNKVDSRFRGNDRWPSNFEFRPIGPSRLWTQFSLALETWRAPVDLLFVPAHTLPILRNPRVKTVVTIHDLGVEYLPGYHQFPQRYYLDFASKYAARHADAIIAVSAATRRDLIKRYGTDGKKIFVVHEGVDTAFFRPSSKFPYRVNKVPLQGKQSVKLKYKIKNDYILFVGTIQPRKNLEMLIEAFPKVSQGVSKRTPGVSLVIAGKLGWDYQDILKSPKKFGVGGQVRFIGRVDDRDLPSLYSGARVFAFPSLFEGFGLPILEALACGCPVIASDIPAHREIMAKLKLTKAMILVKPRDVDGWVKVLYQYISKYEKKSDLYNIKAKLEANFSWNEAAKKSLAVFSRVLG